MKKISGFAHIKAVPKYGDYELRMIHDIITSNNLKEKVEEIIRLYNEGKKEEADKLKSTLWLITPSGTFTERRASCLIDYSNYIVLDFDDVADVESLKEAVKKMSYTLMAFISPSGQGLKVIVEVDSDATRHGLAFNQLQSYYSAIAEHEIDSSGKDICRAMFLSHDPDAYWNEKNEVFHIITDEEIGQSIEVKFNNLLAYTDKGGTYEEGNRNNYLLRLAIVCNRAKMLYEDALMIILERFPDLTKDEIRTVVKNGYKYAVIKPLENRSQTVRTAQMVGTVNLHDLSPKNSPLIPEEVYENLPSILKRATEHITDLRQRDVVLTSSLGILSGCFPQVSGIYDSRETWCNLFVFIIAPAASGKGVLSFSRMLAQSIHDFKPLSLDTNKPNKKLYIPANASSAGIVKQLDINGGNGIICETEADTLSATLAQDWGNFDDLLRKSFHNESVSALRKEEAYEINSPKLSVVLSGTPNQVKSLIPSAENGLLSRFMFYNYEVKSTWKSVAPSKKGSINLNAIFEQLSKDVYIIHEHLRDTNKYHKFDLTEDQWKVLDEKFENWLNKVSVYVPDGKSSVIRLGNILFRVAMSLSLLTHYEDGLDDIDIICEDKTFNTAMMLIDVYFAHMLTTINTLPRKKVNPLLKEEELLLNALPDNAEFTRSEAEQIAEENDICKEKTTGKRLKILVDKGFLIQNGTHKPYRKA